MSARSLLLATFVALATASVVRACLWDTDTLQMERKRFPGANELITGRFVRHSRAYYEWRVKDRLDELAAYPGRPEAIDNLAVAYDKLGRQAEGIAILEKCLADHPDRYETIANLGTLLIHAGELDRGAELIERAIAINPNAHFGREKCQLLLVRYVQQSELKTKSVLCSESRWQHYRSVGFARFALEQAKLPDFAAPGATSDEDPAPKEWPAQKQELEAALKGLLGILHFGNYESPVVLEALGDVLLRFGDGPDDARLLAARAYLSAASHVKNSDAAAALETMAHDALTANEDYHRKPLEDSVAPVARKLKEDVAAAKEWYQQIANDEAEWIRQGVDVDLAFATKYYDSLERTVEQAADDVAKEPPDERDSNWVGRSSRRGIVRLLACVGAAVLAVAAVVRVLIWRFDR